MQTNNVFSIQRFMLLGKQSLIINKKMIGISLAGFVGILFIALILFQSASDEFKRWDNNSYLGTFLSVFFSLGIIYASHAFPAFRSKERSMTYLMLPASASEKFIFELLTRIILFILVIPLLYWVVANLEGAVVHHFVPELTNYKFSFVEPDMKVNGENKMVGWGYFAILQGVLFVFISTFAGASHFTKSPLLKTMFAFSVIAAGYGLFTYLLVKGLNIEAYHPANNRVLFIKNAHDSIVFTAIATTAINLCLLAIAWFSLKEKEA